MAKVGSKPAERPSRRVAVGPFAEVWLFDDALSEFDALSQRNDQTSVQAKRRLERYFQRFADIGPQGFDERMFKSAERLSDGQGGRILIHEFKAYQFRVYGAIATYNGKRCFLGTQCDPSKKKDKADVALLKKAALLIREICHAD